MDKSINDSQWILVTDSLQKNPENLVNSAVEWNLQLNTFLCIQCIMIIMQCIIIIMSSS